MRFILRGSASNDALERALEKHLVHWIYDLGWTLQMFTGLINSLMASRKLFRASTYLHLDQDERLIVVCSTAVWNRRLKSQVSCAKLTIDIMRVPVLSRRITEA